ncbi:MAG: Ig-like domain-containing protein, partial [Armatimonadota bacterium]
MRRFLLPLVLLALVVSPAMAQKGVLSVGDITAAPGEVVSVDVVMDANLKNIAGVQFTLEFRESTPPGAPTLLGVENPNKPGSGEADLVRGPMVPGGDFVLANVKVPGEIKVGIVGTEGFSGPGTLVTVKIQIPADVPSGTVYKLNIKDVTLNDPDVNPVEADIKGGTLTVQAPVPPAPKLAKIEVTAPTTSLKVGETVILSAKALDEAGAEITGQTFVWASSNTAVAVVDETGKVTAVAEGTADITAAVGDVKSAPVTIIVEAVPPPVGNVLVLGTHVLRPGVAATIGFRITKPDKAAGVKFVIEYNPALLTFSAEGAKAVSATAIAAANADYVDPEGKIKPTDPANKLLSVAVADNQAVQATSVLVTIPATLKDTTEPMTTTSLTVVSGSLEFRDVDGNVIAGDVKGSGLVIAGSATAGWSTWLGAEITSSVSSVGDRIVAVNDEGKVAVLSAADGTAVAGVKAPTLSGAVDGRPIIAGGTVVLKTEGDKTVFTLAGAGVYAATKTGDVAAFALDDGAELFAPKRFAEGAKVVPGVFGDKGALYVASGSKITVIGLDGAELAS